MKFLKNILKSIKGIIVSLILILVIVFMINNREIVEVTFDPLPFEKIQTRIFFLILISYLLGLITAIIIYSSNMIKSALRNIKYNSRCIQSTQLRVIRAGLMYKRLYENASQLRAQPAVTRCEYWRWSANNANKGENQICPQASPPMIRRSFSTRKRSVHP